MPPPINRLFIPHAYGEDVNAALSLVSHFTDLITSKRGTFSHVNYPTTEDTTTALEAIKATYPGVSFSSPPARREPTRRPSAQTTPLSQPAASAIPASQTPLTTLCFDCPIPHELLPHAQQTTQTRAGSACAVPSDQVTTLLDAIKDTSFTLVTLPPIPSVNERSRRLQSLLLGFVPTSTRQALEVALIVTRADLAPPYIMPPLITTPSLDEPLVHEVNTSPDFGHLWEVYSQDGNGAYRATLHALLASLTALTVEDYNRRMLAISTSITGLTQDTRSLAPILEITDQHEMLERHLLKTNDNQLMATLRHAAAGFVVRQLGLPLGHSHHGWNSLITTQVWKDPTYVNTDPAQGLRFNSTSQFITQAILNTTAEPSALVLYALANSLNCNIMLSLPTKELAKAYALLIFNNVDCTVFITVADSLPDAHILLRNDKYHSGTPPSPSV